MKLARADQERWWTFQLGQQQQQQQQLAESTSRDDTKKLHKKWKKIKDKQYEKRSSFEPRPVHRLDIDTSGIVCVALTPYALRAANMLFERKSVNSFANNEEGSSGSGSSSSKSLLLESEEEEEEEGYTSIVGVQKRYVALTEGTLGENGESNEGSPTTTTKTSETAGVIKHSIGKVWIDDHHEWACDISNDGTVPFIRPDKNGDPKDVVAVDSCGSGSGTSFVPGSLREAITSYNVIDGVDDHDDDGTIPTALLNSNDHTTDTTTTTTRVELTPHTGRGHQLRLHMSSIGHPIVGDDMHGNDYARGGADGKEAEDDGRSPTVVNGGRLCLHAAKLSMDVWCASSNDDEEEDYGGTTTTATTTTTIPLELETSTMISNSL